jgi:hypothetical protein
MKAVLPVLIVLAWQSHAAPPVEVETRTASALGVTAMSVNGSVHSHGRPAEVFFEFGTTTAYGSRTPAQPLPPRLAAYYRESWDEGGGGWFTGMNMTELEHFPEGGAKGGFVRYSEPSTTDPNHLDGIGGLHLVKYLYPASFGAVTPRLSAGDPDLRGARVLLRVRGNQWTPNGSELLWWQQSQSNIQLGGNPGWRRANWACTFANLTERLRSGKWETLDYHLHSDSDLWTYAGNNLQQANAVRYSYWPIEESLRHANIDFFHLLAFIDPKNPPTGSIDFDEFQLTYRNYSLLLPSNGGRLVNAPEGAAALTDGWRHGRGKTWRSAANPAQPLDFVYAFSNPVTIQSVQLHQNPEWPAKDVEVLVSNDGKTFDPLLQKQLPEKGTPNANFAFTLDGGLSAAASFLKVRVLSGYKAAHWGLGEIEVFGSGAIYLPEDGRYFSSADIRGLEAGRTYHYRFVASTSGGMTAGEDYTFTVPLDTKPQVQPQSPRQITVGSVRLEGRVNAMGQRTGYCFEYGSDANYGSRTAMTDAGLQITPRTVFATLTGLQPGRTYHYRLVARNGTGESVSGDSKFKVAEQ